MMVLVIERYRWFLCFDYLINVKDYGFFEVLTGGKVKWTLLKKGEQKVLLLPPKNKDCNLVIKYLLGCGIDYQFIKKCITDSTIYDSTDYHNAVKVKEWTTELKKERMMRFLVFNSNSMIAYYRVEIYAVLNLDQQGGMKVQTGCI